MTELGSILIKDVYRILAFELNCLPSKPVCQRICVNLFQMAAS